MPEPKSSPLKLAPALAMGSKDVLKVLKKEPLPVTELMSNSFGFRFSGVGVFGAGEQGVGL